MHHGGREVPERGIKTGVISILAIGLLAGSAVGVAAQEGATTITATVESSPDVGCDYDNLTNIATCANVVVEASDPRLSGVVETIVYALDVPASEGAWSGIGTYGFVAGFEHDALSDQHTHTHSSGNVIA